ncbi:MAG TPA: LPS assembly lipoprotein LptE [Vicinamibacterales bacterium]|jgi:hypothetical protein
MIGVRVPRTLLASFIALAAITSGSCGYALAGRGSYLPATIKTIGIPDFVNRTPYFEVGQTLAQRVRSEFIGRGKYRVLPQQNGTDAVLRVTINSIGLVPASFNENQQATRYVITVAVGIEFVQASDNKVLWQNPSQLFREEYSLTTGSGVVDAAAFFGQASNAVDRMATDFARSVVSAILEAF